MADVTPTARFRFWLWLIRFLGVLVPRRLRLNWRQEWEAELQYREMMLAEWDKLNWRTKLDLLWRSLGAFRDALLLQPQRLEDDMFQDLRYGVRMLGKTPGLTIMAVLSLALGIGANTAIFSLTDAVLLRMLPVKQPEQLVFLEQSGQQGTKRSSNLTDKDLEYLRQQNQLLARVCSFSFATRINASIGRQAEMVEGQVVSGGFFPTLGIEPAAGRTFTEEDDKTSGNQSVAVISYNFWKRRFALDPTVVGQTWVFNNAPFTIIGITPKEFYGVIIGTSPDVFLPSVAGEQILPRRVSNRNGPLPFVLARLKPDVSQSQAGAALTLLLQQTRSAEAGTQLTPEKQQAIERLRLDVKPASQGFSALRQQFSEPLRFLLVVTGLVLLIACGNVANLLLARAAGRRKEIAVRLALGATRFRLIRQLLTESLLLALLGGICGLVLAYWCSDLLVSLLSSGRNPVTAGATLFLDVPLDSRVLGFTAAVSMLTGILFGLAPALQATRLELTPALNENARGVGGQRFRWGRFLVMGQVALSLTLLVGAGLFVRSLGKLQGEDLGFKPENVLLFSVDPQLIRYQGAQIAGLYKQMLERIATLPGVSSVSLSRQGLLNGGGTQGSIKVSGYTPDAAENSMIQTREGAEWNAPWFCQVGPKFFETAGLTLLRGRDITSLDNETAPKVAVVNETFARYYFGNAEPIGKRFDRGPDDGGEVEIVGLVKDAKNRNIREETPRTFYIPFLQDPSSWRETTFQVRTTGQPLQLVEAIRREVQGIDEKLPIFRVRTLQAQIDESLGQERLVAALSSLFGLLALLLACAGLYGVLSYCVSRRTQEIGIRLALGAKPGDVLKLVMRQGITLTLGGLAIGLIGAWTVTRLLVNLLYGISATDSLTFISVSLLLTLFALLACYLPARRATKVDPLAALRHE
jgi:predicted permease